MHYFVVEFFVICISYCLALYRSLGGIIGTRSVDRSASTKKSFLFLHKVSFIQNRAQFDPHTIHTHHVGPPTFHPPSRPSLTTACAALSHCSCCFAACPLLARDHCFNDPGGGGFYLRRREGWKMDVLRSIKKRVLCVGDFDTPFFVSFFLFGLCCGGLPFARSKKTHTRTVYNRRVPPAFRPFPAFPCP